VFCIKGKAMSNNAMSNETDLDWLARNVHEWAEDWTHVRKCPVRHEAKWMASLSPNAEYKDWRTKQQWLARRAKLQNKPTEWPKRANWLAQNGGGEWAFYSDSADNPPQNRPDGNWYSDDVEVKFCHSGEVLGDWRDTLEKRPSDLSEQMVMSRLQEATDNVLAAAKELKYDKYKFDPFVSIEGNQEQDMKQDN